MSEAMTVEDYANRIDHSLVALLPKDVARAQVLGDNRGELAQTLKGLAFMDGRSEREKDLLSKLANNINS